MSNCLIAIAPECARAFPDPAESGNTLDSTMLSHFLVGNLVSTFPGMLLCMGENVIPFGVPEGSPGNVHPRPPRVLNEERRHPALAHGIRAGSSLREGDMPRPCAVVLFGQGNGASTCASSATARRSRHGAGRATPSYMKVNGFRPRR